MFLQGCIRFLKRKPEPATAKVLTDAEEQEEQKRRGRAMFSEDYRRYLKDHSRAAKRFEMKRRLRYSKRNRNL